MALPGDWAWIEAAEAWQRAPTPCLPAGLPCPLLCPVRRRDNSQIDIEYQTYLIALVEKIKTAVHCSHLWVLFLGVRKASRGGLVGVQPLPKALGAGPGLGGTL